MDTNVLFLEAVPNADQLFHLLGAAPARADSPLQAAWALASGSTDIIVVGSDASWAHDLIASLPPQQRPAVVAVGTESPVLCGLVDGWLKPGASTDQVADCVTAALGRAHRRTARIAPRSDPDSGLSNREALTDALVRKLERARRDHQDLSLVVVRVVGNVLRAAALLGASTRRNEVTARVGVDLFATLLHAGPVASERARRRFEERLRLSGILATATSHLLPLAAAVECLERAIGPSSPSEAGDEAPALSA